MKRFLKIVAVLALFVLVGGYVAFRSLFFDPFGAGRASLDPLVPKDVHFMARRADLAADFSPFPLPRVFELLRLKDEWKAFAATRWYADTIPAEAIARAFDDLARLPAQIDPLDLMADLAGREALVCGRWREDGQLAWAAIARGSFRAKLFADAVRFGIARDAAGGALTDYSEQEEVRSFTVEGARWHLARSEDALIAGNDFELVRDVRALAEGSGLSLDDSPQYRSAILSPSPVGRPIDFMVDAATACKRLGIAAVPALPEDPLPIRYVKALLDPAYFGQVVGRLALGNVAELSASCTVDRTALSPVAGGLLGGTSGDLAESWTALGRIFPAKVAVAGHLRIDVKQLLRRLEGLLDADVRRILNEDVIPNFKFDAGLYQPKSTVELLDSFADVVNDEVYFACEPDEPYPPPGAPEGTFIYPNPRNGPRWALIFPATDKEIASRFVANLVKVLASRRREIPTHYNWTYEFFPDIKFSEFETADPDLPPFGLGVLELHGRACVVLTTTGKFLDEIVAQKLNAESNRPVGLQAELQFRQAQDAASGFGQGFVFVSSERLRKVIDDLCVVYAEDATRPDWTKLRRDVERDVVRQRHPDLARKALDEAARKQIEPEVDREIEKREVQWRDEVVPARAAALRKDLDGLAIFRWCTLAYAVQDRELALRLRLAAPVPFGDTIRD